MCGKPRCYGLAFHRLCLSSSRGQVRCWGLGRPGVAGLGTRPWDLGGALDELADNAASKASSGRVSLGLEAPGGFSGADLVSPAQAVAAGALADQRFRGGGAPGVPIYWVVGACWP